MLSLALAFLAAQSVLGSRDEYPVGDIRNCPMMSPINQSVPLLRMEVLPGGGFDNLRNLDMGQVFFYNYSTCKVSSDGRYILPDSIFLIPEQQSKVDVFSEYFDHWDDYTSTTSNSINVDVSSSFAAISAKFSTEWQSVKEKQFNTNSKTTRTQVRHKLYKVQVQPNSQLHPNLKSLLFDIMANLQRNNTHYANYLADLIIRDYGTHYVLSMDAGAVLSQVDHVSDKFVQSHQSDSTKITASASATFFSVVKFSASFQHLQNNSDTNGFTSNRTHSQVFTFGGPPFRPDFTVNDWEDGVRDALVPIDRAGYPLYYAINPITLPELVDSDSFEVQNIVFNATRRYYAANTVRGCTDQTASNFAFTANVEGGHCNRPAKNSSFGGIYQVCTTSPQDIQSPYVDLCKTKNLNQVNTRTGTYTCPSGYQHIELYSATLSQHGTKGERVCGAYFLRCWSHKTVQVPITSFATYTTYWCAATGTVEPTDGYLFGGAFTSNQVNPATSSLSCPIHFQQFRMGVDGIVCASEEFEQAFQFSVPFAGFESCRVGNPLTVSEENQAHSSKWLHDCPVGFSKYLLMVENGCEISYCIKSELFETKTLPPARQPPFSKFMHNVAYFDAPMTLIGSRNKIWIKDDDSIWRIATLEQTDEIVAAMSSISPPPIVDESNTTNTTGTILMTKLSNGAVAAISVITTFVFCTAIACAIFVGVSVGKRRQVKKGAGHESYENLSGSNCVVNELEPNESHTTTT